eukprot:3326518-Prymnesium_polylepis.1
MYISQGSMSQDRCSRPSRNAGVPRWQSGTSPSGRAQLNTIASPPWFRSNKGERLLGARPERHNGRICLQNTQLRPSFLR